MPTDPIALKVLDLVALTLEQVLAPEAFATKTKATSFDGRRLLVRTDDGHTVEITARLLEPDDPAAVRLGETVTAIDNGDVE
jgi:hypothetical protein